MALQLLINGVDHTAYWRPFESRWTMRAWMGESSQSTFILDDFDGALDHANLAARKIVEVWEDGSGSSVCLYRGRVANKPLGMGPSQVNPAMRWQIDTEDYNIDLRGIIVAGVERPEETDDARVEWLRLEYLNGAASVSPKARNSTNLDGNFIGSTPGDAITIPAEDYTDTNPVDVLQRIAQATARMFWVHLMDDGDGELVYMSRGDQTIVSDITLITDDGEDDAADGIDIYAAYKSPSAGDHAGQDVLSGAAIRWQGGYHSEGDVGGAASTYDKWEETFTFDNIRNDDHAQNVITRIVQNHDEGLTFFATIDMRAAHVHRIRAGMWVDQFRRRRANKGGLDGIRVFSCTVEPQKADEDGEAWYRVSLELGRPQLAARTFPRSRRQIPRPADPAEPGTVSSGRIYFTEATETYSGLDNTDYSTDWDFAGPSAVDGPLKLDPDPQDTCSNAGSGHTHDGINVAQGSYAGIIYARRLSELPAAVLSTIQGGGTFRMVMRSANRVGTGVSGPAQDNFPQVIGRVYRPGTSTFLGTLFDQTATYEFDITSPSVYPSIPIQSSVTAIASAVGTDVLVLDLGASHIAPTTGATGWKYRPSDQSELDDLPFVVDSVADLNSWAEFSSSSSGTGNGGHDDLVNPEDTDNCYARCGHRHHVTRDRAPTPADDETQGYPTGTFWVQVDDTTTPTEIIATYLSVDDTADDAVWLLQADLSETGGGGSSTLTIEEEDGPPSGVFDTLKVSNGRLTDNGDGSASLDVTTVGVHSHDPPTPGFHGTLVKRTTDFTSTNTNDSVPDFDSELYDTDGMWDAGDPDRLTVPAAFDGLMMQFYATGLWASSTNDYTEIKIYRNVTRPIDDGGSDEGGLLAVAQIPPATAFNTQPLALSPPVQVATGDEIFVTFRTPASETVVDYFDVSLLFGAWVVGSGGASALTVREVGGSDIEDVAELEFDADDFVVTDEGGGVARVALTSSGGSGVPPGILLVSDHSTPFTFDEILQTSDGTDFLWESE